MLYFVADKKAIVNLRVRPEVRDQFAIAAELRGASMSGLLHQFIVRTIREERDLNPAAFGQISAVSRTISTSTVDMTPRETGAKREESESVSVQTSAKNALKPSSSKLRGATPKEEITDGKGSKGKRKTGN